MLISEIPQRYAKALLDLTKSMGHHSKALDELTVLASVLHENSEIQNFINNPIISSREKGQILLTALSGKNVVPELRSLIELLAKKQRLHFLGDIAIALRQAIDLEEGTTRGVVRSAQPLSANMRVDLESKIMKILNKKIVLTYTEDPSLLGGMVAQVGGWKFDDSIETHLKRMSDELNRRAN